MLESVDAVNKGGKSNGGNRWAGTKALGSVAVGLAALGSAFADVPKYRNVSGQNQVNCVLFAPAANKSMRSGPLSGPRARGDKPKKNPSIEKSTQHQGGSRPKTQSLFENREPNSLASGPASPNATN